MVLERSVFGQNVEWFCRDYHDYHHHHHHDQYGHHHWYFYHQCDLNINIYLLFSEVCVSQVQRLLEPKLQRRSFKKFQSFGWQGNWSINNCQGCRKSKLIRTLPAHPVLLLLLERCQIYLEKTGVLDAVGKIEAKLESQVWHWKTRMFMSFSISATA